LLSSAWTVPAIDNAAVVINIFFLFSWSISILLGLVRIKYRTHFFTA
jgi:hypothetical protein